MHDAFADLPDLPAELEAHRQLRVLSIYDAPINFSDKVFSDRMKIGYGIQDKETGAVIPFAPLLKRNPPQLKLIKRLLKLLKTGGPIRVMILKGRKLGASTLVLALLLELAQQLGWGVGALTHTQDSCDVFFRIMRRMWEMTPKNARVPMKSLQEGSRIEFGERSRAVRHEGATGDGGIIQTSPAKGGYPFTSDTIRAAIMSECAKYDLVGDMEAQMALILSVLGAIPKNAPSLVVAETTANGQQGWFYDNWKQFDVESPQDRDVVGNVWHCIFISWLEDPTTRAYFNVDRYDWSNWPIEDREREDELIRVYGATREHLVWRRTQIRTEMKMEFDLFDQEFPTTAQHAFLGSGKPAIPRNLLNEQAQNIIEPIEIYSSSYVETPLEEVTVSREVDVP